MIGGVAAGLGAYFGIDVAIARIVWGILLLAGIGLPIYLICWIAMPLEQVIRIDDMFDDDPPKRSLFLTLVKIVLLLIVGAIIASNVSSDMAVIMFIVGLAFGLYHLWRNRAQADESESFGASTTRLYRSETNRRILGVFGGLGDALNVDPTLLRVLGGIVLIAGFPVIVPLYLLYAIVVPSRRVITL